LNAAKNLLLIIKDGRTYKNITAARP